MFFLWLPQYYNGRVKWLQQRTVCSTKPKLFIICPFREKCLLACDWNHETACSLHPHRHHEVNVTFKDGVVFERTRFVYECKILKNSSDLRETEDYFSHVNLQSKPGNGNLMIIRNTGTYYLVHFPSSTYSFHSMIQDAVSTFVFYSGRGKGKTYFLLRTLPGNVTLLLIPH